MLLIHQQHKLSVHTTPQSVYSAYLYTLMYARQPDTVLSLHLRVTGILECTKRVYCSRCHPPLELDVEHQLLHYMLQHPHRAVWNPVQDLRDRSAG